MLLCCDIVASSAAKIHHDIEAKANPMRIALLESGRNVHARKMAATIAHARGAKANIRAGIRRVRSRSINWISGLSLVSNVMSP